LHEIGALVFSLDLLDDVSQVLGASYPDTQPKPLPLTIDLILILLHLKLENVLDAEHSLEVYELPLHFLVFLLDLIRPFLLLQFFQAVGENVACLYYEIFEELGLDDQRPDGPVLHDHGLHRRYELPKADLIALDFFKNERMLAAAGLGGGSWLVGLVGVFLFFILVFHDVNQAQVDVFLEFEEVLLLVGGVVDEIGDLLLGHSSLILACRKILLNTF